MVRVASTDRNRQSRVRIGEQDGAVWWFGDEPV
jgi:hypothetical protein